jgi:glycerophosphoryl diester phosphodiesterase
MPHAFFDNLAPTLVIPHRFGALEWPEGTRVALEGSTRESGARLHELDVQATRDGELVVVHNPTVDDYTEAKGRIAERTLAELRQLDFGYRFSSDGGRSFPFRGQGLRVMTLEEVLECSPTLRFNVELKPESGHVVARFERILREAKAVDRCCVGSSDDTVAHALARALPDAVHFLPFGLVAPWFLSLRMGAPRPAIPAPFGVLDTPYRLEGDLPAVAAPFAGQLIVEPQLMQAAREDRLWVNVWTINDEQIWKSLLDLKVGGIITDRPRALHSLMESRARAG